MAIRPVIVIGAGIAGLTSAYYLSKFGADVTVLEASGRPGGRMSTDRRDGYVLDRGVQFLSGEYSVINELINELGLKKNLSVISSWTGTVRGGSVRRTNIKYPWTVAGSGLLSWRDAFRLAAAGRSLSRKTKQFSLSNYSKWHSLDDADAAEWIEKTFDKNILEYIFEPMLEGLYFQAPENMSRAWPAAVWNFGARGQSVTALEGGNGILTETLAGKLKVYTNTPAEAIDTSGSGVNVKTPAGWLEADGIVLAATTPAVRHLYQPGTDVENRLLNTEYSSTININFAVPDGVSKVKVRKNIYGLLIPRRERHVIAAISFESQKCRGHVPQGELLNIMLSGAAGSRLINEPDDAVLSEVIPDLQRFFPGIESGISFAHFNRWQQAEPRSPIGRSRDIDLYRKTWNKNMKVILAGDYMSIPCSEGAAESGKWAACNLAGIFEM